MSLKQQIGKAVKLYESFREAAPRTVGAVRVNVPRAVAVMGYVEGIDYRTTHGKKLTLYHHDFEPGSRPLLAVSADGKQLLLLGGRYKFTAQGIVDKDARGRLITNPKHGKNIKPRRKNARPLDAAEGQAITSYARLHRLPSSIVSTMRILYMNDPALWSKKGLSKLETEVQAMARTRKGNPAQTARRRWDWWWGPNGNTARARQAARRPRANWYGPFSTRGEAIAYARANGWKNAK